MTDAPTNEEIMTKFRKVMELIMKESKNVKDLMAMAYALTAALEAIEEELDERKR